MVTPRSSCVPSYLTCRGNYTHMRVVHTAIKALTKRLVKHERRSTVVYAQHTSRTNSMPFSRARPILRGALCNRNDESPRVPLFLVEQNRNGSGSKIRKQNHRTIVVIQKYTKTHIHTNTCLYTFHRPNFPSFVVFSPCFATVGGTARQQWNSENKRQPLSTSFGRIFFSFGSLFSFCWDFPL